MVSRGPPATAADATPYRGYARHSTPSDRRHRKRRAVRATRDWAHRPEPLFRVLLPLPVGGRLRRRRLPGMEGRIGGAVPIMVLKS